MLRGIARLYTVTSVPDGPIVSRVIIEVEVVWSNLPRDSSSQIDRPKGRERELGQFDAKSTNIKSGKVGMLNGPYHLCAIKNEGEFRVGRRKDACDHGLSRRSLVVRTSYELSWRVKGDD